MKWAELVPPPVETVARTPMTEGDTMTLAMTSRNWRDLIRPKNITIETESSTDFYGKFTWIPDVVEDVTDIIMNLKEVVLKAATPKTYTVRIDKEGPGPVYAKDIA